MAHQYDAQPRSPASPQFYGPNGMDPSRNGLPSPSSGRFAPIAARGGNFLAPVSQPPSRPTRRPSGGQTLAFPSPPLQQPYTTPASPSLSIGSARERTSSSSSAHGGSSYPSPAPRQRHASGDGLHPGQPTAQQSPRRQDQYVSLGAGYPGKRPGSGGAMESPSTGSAYSQASYQPASSTSPRVPPPSSPRQYHQPTSQSVQSSPQASHDTNGYHSKSASLPSALASPSSARHHSHSGQARQHQHQHQHQQHHPRTASDPSMRVGGVSSLGGRDGRGANGRLGEVWEEGGSGEDGRLDEVESRTRKMSSSEHRSPQAPSPSQFYPSAINGGRGSAPPPRPQPPSQGLYSPPDASSSFPAPLHPARPNNQRRSSTPSVGTTQSMSAASPASSRKVSFPKGSMDVQRALADGGGYEEFGSTSSPKKDKTLTPKKSSGVLRSLFGKRKDSMPASSPPVPKSSISSPQPTPPTPSGARTPTSVRTTATDATFSPRMHSDSPASISTNHTKHSTPPAKLAKRRPSFEGSPAAQTPFDPPPGSTVSPRPSQPPSAFKLAPPPPRPTPTRDSNEPTPSSSTTFSETSSKVSPTHLAHLRRGSDTSSSSSLSYLAGGPANPLTRSFSSSPPSNHTARLPNSTLHPHLKPSGSLKLLELPSFESGLMFEPSGEPRQATSPEQASAKVSLGRPLERDDSWGDVFAAGLAVDSGNANRQSTASTATTTTTSDWEGAGDLDRAIRDFGQAAPHPVATATAPPQPPPPLPAPAASHRKAVPAQTIPPLPVPPALPKALPSSTPASPPSRKPNHLTIAVGLPETRALPVVVAVPEPLAPSISPVMDTAPLKIKRRPSAADQTLSGAGSSTADKTAAEEAEHRRRGSASALAILLQGQQPKVEGPPPPLVLPKSDSVRVVPKREVLTIQAARLVQTKKPVHHRDLADKMMQCLDTLQSTAARAPLIRGVLLPVLYDDERRGFDPRQVDENKAMRTVCFDWLVTLLQKGIWLEQTANERGAVLEAVAALLESPALSVQALETDEGDALIFRKIMRTVVSFVMTKLSSKGIFQNTLSFAGRMLAFAFFRVEGIAQQLLAALPVTRMALARLETQIYESEAASSDNTYVHETAPFLSHLDPFVFRDPRQYLLSIGSAYCNYDDSDDEAAFRFQPGNWLRRWQSDDSELFFSFFRAYHKQLVPFFPSLGDAHSGKRMKASALLAVPGYAHLATIFATKCLSYIQGKVVSVTTTASSATFNSSETAFAAASGKPNVLENANRRLSETVNYLLATPALVDIEYGTEVEGTRVWGSMSDVWVRFTIGRTNLYEPKGVFCLFDLLDAITAHPADPFRDTSVALVPSSSDAFSTAFIISTLEVILRNGDHALTLCKCVSFVFQHWETLTATPSDRNRLLELLLERETFERMALFWSTSVRSYFVRLIVFRLSHVKTTVGQDKQPTETEVLSLKMLNLRLEAVRRRFAELEPSVLGALLEDEEVPGTASTMADHPSSAASNLSRSRSTISMIPAPPAPASDSSRTSEDGSPSAREQLGGVGGAGGPGADASGAGAAEVIAAGGALGKATQWFKKSFASKKKASARSGSAGSLGAASSSSSIVSGKSLPGISEAAEDDEDQPYPISPIRERPYPTTPLFTPLPTVHEPYGGVGTDLLSPARSSFESAASPNSPAESFFSEKQEDALVSADVYRQQRNTGLALPPRTASTSSSSDQSHGSSISTGDGLSAFSPQQQSLSVPSSSTTASPGGQSGVFSFEFATSPVSDSFEVPVSSSIAHPSLTFTPSGTSPLDPLLPIHSSHPPPSPTNPTTSMRMSRSFSRRSSLLTPLAQNVLESLAEGKPLPPTSPIRGRKEQGYDKSRHCYAHRFFAEMEDTLQEYQEWYAVGTGPGGVEGGDGAPPRLTVGWSFNDDE